MAIIVNEYPKKKKQQTQKNIFLWHKQIMPEQEKENSMYKLSSEGYGYLAGVTRGCYRHYFSLEE